MMHGSSRLHGASRRWGVLAIFLMLWAIGMAAGCFQTRSEVIGQGEGMDAGALPGNWLVWMDHAATFDRQHPIFLTWNPSSREYILTPQGSSAPLGRCRAFKLDSGLYAVQYHVADPSHPDMFLLLVRVEAQGRLVRLLVVDDAAAAELAKQHGLDLQGDLLGVADPGRMKAFLKAVALRPRPGETPYVYVHESYADAFTKGLSETGR